MVVRAFWQATFTAAILCSSPSVLAAERCVSDVPNGYVEQPNWASLPAGRSWGATGAVASGPAGDIWVADRCGGTSCSQSTLSPIFHFDRNGMLLANFGAGLFVQPHGIHVDPKGDIWVADFQAADGKGQQVIKFSPSGRVMMRLGVAGVAGTDPGTFNQPTAIATAANGDVLVAEGHAPTNGNSRITRFSAEGRIRTIFGHQGTGPEDFMAPHALAFDHRGRLFVADIGNNRITIFDRKGKVVDHWQQFGRPSGLFIDAQDRMVVADATSTEQNNPGCRRGIRVGNARTGRVIAFIPDSTPVATAGPTTGAEGATIGADGAIYGAEVSSRALRKYLPARR